MSNSRLKLSLAELCQPLHDARPPPAAATMANSSSPPVHAGTKRPLTIDDQDEDVRIAVKALGDMRSRAVAHARAPSAEAFAAVAKAHSRASSASQSTPLLTHSSTSASTSASSPISPQSSIASEPQPNEEISSANLDVSNEDFVSRVSHLPIVNTALKAYDYSKERSRVVKYGANLMESSVKTISRPVIDRLPVGQLDDFACRQLDRLGYPKSNTPEASTSDAPRTQFLEYAYREPLPQPSRETSRAPSVAPSGTDDYSSQDPPGSPGRHTTKPRDSSREENKDQNDKQVASRSKWQAMLLEAGGIGAAVSEESMKRLQYCLQWLQYATARIDSQIALLRSFIDSLSPQPPHQNDPQALVPLQTMRSLTDVRRDVVSTIRQVVDVISQYAGGALPEPARASVRAFILRLPTRWANANQDASAAQPAPQQQPPSGPNRTEAQEPSAPIPPHMRPTAGRGTHPTASTATRTAQRILTFATESLDMMRSITAVFKESLDRAEAWVERLRVVGIQRQGALLPPPSQPSSPSAGHTVGHEEETSPPNIHADAAQPPPPSPSISLSSSMHSLTSLSIATQVTSPPPSIVGGSRPFFRPGTGEDDAEGETETEEDDGTPRQGPDASMVSKDDKEEGRKQNMDVDG